MNIKKILIVFFIILIVTIALNQYFKDKKTIDNKQAQINEPVPVDIVEIVDIPKEIIDNTLLIDKVVVSKPKVATSTPVKKIINANLITSESYLVGNIETGQIYLDSNSSKVFPIASLSKLITALIDSHNMDSIKQITITQKMLDTFGDAGHLVKNEKFTPHELLYPLLLESSNDAAEALAQSYGYTEFIKLMNNTVKIIGMNNSSFKDASGLSSQNVSTSRDLFTLAQYYYKNEKDLLDITKTKEIEFATTTDHGYHHFFSINPFVFYAPFIGGKTGRTDEALESMFTLLNYDIGTTTYPIAIIVLRSKYGERGADTERILGLLNKKMLIKNK